MKTIKIVEKTCFGVILILILQFTLNNCSKSDKNTGSKFKTITINMSDPKYSVLKTNITGSVTVENVVVGNNMGSGYWAAESICPSCGGNIRWNPEISDIAWICIACQSGWDGNGSIVRGPTIVTLKVYPVHQSGDILTVTVPI
jgi:hypothetical protein